MKKIFLIALIFLFIGNVNAEECTEQKLNELKQQAESIIIDTEFDEEAVAHQQYDTSYITIQGLPEGFYIYTKNRNKLYEYKNNVNGIIKDKITKNEEKMYVFNDICPNKIIREINLKLKKYNVYANSIECEGISGDELDVCDENYSKDITFNEFVAIVNDYRRKKENNNEQIITKKNYKYIILGIVGIILFGIIIILLNNRRKKNILD